MRDASVALINLYSKSYLSTQCKVCRKAIILQEQIISYTSISLQAGKSKRICHRLMHTPHMVHALFMELPLARLGLLLPSWARLRNGVLRPCGVQAPVVAAGFAVVSVAPFCRFFSTL